MQLRTEMRERLRRSRDWVGTIEELEREADGAGTDAERSRRLYELGALTEEIVPERERALAFYQRAWKLDPQNIDALTRARELYGELGRLEMVAKVGELELTGRGDSPEAAALAAIVGEAMLDTGDRERAAVLLETALEAAPDDTRARDALAAAEYDAEDWMDMVERLQANAGSADSATAARMLLRAARIVRFEQGDPALCESLLEKVLENEPQNESANYLYESLLAAAERWDELEAHHERRAYAAPEDELQAELYRRFALEWVQRFGDRARGARFFSRAIEASSQNGAVPLRSLVAAFSLIREIYGARAEWEHILSLADGCVSRLGEDDRLFVALQAGLVAWKELGDAERARRYFDIVREIDAEWADLVEFETEVGPGGEAGPSAAASPAGDATATTTGTTPATPATTPATTEDEHVEPTAQGKPKKRKGRKTGANSADAASTDSHGDAPGDGAPDAVGTVPEPEREVEEAEEISAELSSAMDEARSSEEAGPDKAIDAWRKVIAQAPDKRAPRRELARVLREAGRWNALIEALKEEEQKAATGAAAKVGVLREMVAVYRDELRQDLPAVNALNQILSLDSGNLEVIDTLAAQYEGMKRWPDLVSTLGKKAEAVSDDAEKIALYLRVANLYIEKFSNQAEAIKAFEKVLALDPDNDEAVTHLIAVYEKRRDWEKLIRLREREIERTEDPADRAEKVYEIAKLASTRLKKPDICTVWWAKVLEHDPANEEALGELEKLYERGKNWDKLAEVCAKKAAIATDPKAQTDSLQKLGLLYTDKVQEPRKAIEAWRRLLDIDANHRRAQDSLKKLYVAEQAWDELEEFYRGRGRLDEYVRVLERQVDAGPESDRVPLAMKIAGIYRDELEKPDRATRAFEKVLSFDEENLEAAEALIPLYEGGRDPRKLVRVLEVQLAKTDDPALRQERIKRLAEFSEERLRDKGAALGWWLAAHAEDHEAEWIRAEVERLADETGGWPQVVEAYESSYDKFSSRAEALPLMLVVARVLETELGEIDRALETNQAILEVDETNEQALDALERLYLGKGEFEKLLEIYNSKLGLEQDADARAQIQHKIGQLYEDEVKDDDRAVEAYASLLDMEPDNLPALSALDRIYLRGERWNDLAEILIREISNTSPDDARADYVALSFRLGQIREIHLEDVAGAIDSYREILDLDPTHAGAREALEGHLTDHDHQLAAAGILEPIYEQIEEWGRLVDVHEIQIAADDDQFRRVELLMKVGDLQAARLGDAEKAFGAYARAFREDPATEDARQKLEELCGLLDEGWNNIVALYEEAIARDDLDPPLTHELAMKVAHAAQDRLENTDKAVEYYRRALQIEPDDLAAIEALERVFTRDEKYPELLEVYRRKADISTDPDERMGILFRIASIHEEMLQNADEAILAYNEILGHDGDNLHALRALDRLYVQGGQWQDLGDNLSRQLVLCEDDHERVALLLRLAQLRETQLEELAAAIETYRQVLDIQPDNVDAIGALERLISNPDYELTIAQILEPIYQATANWEAQIGVYEIMARHAFDPARKIELLHGIAELYEVGRDDGGAAFDTFARSFREEPRDDTTQKQLERLARMFDRWRDLVALYDEVIADIGDEELKIQLLTKLAQIYELELMEDQNAVATYERILEVSANHIEAASAIQTLHERNADYPALVGALKQKSEILLDLAERKQLLYRAAQIEEEILDDVDAAIATFQAVLELDDLDAPAMDALERLYIRLERWEPLKDVYAKKADLAEDPDDKKRMLYVLGQVYDRELGDVAKAIETYQAILDIDIDELAAIQALDRLYGQAERWYDLLQNLERQVELAESTGEAVGLKYRIGHLWQHQLQDLARAIETYREALELDPGHQETLLALDELLHSEEGEPVMAARVLEPIYEAGAEFDRLADVLEVMAAHADDPVGKVGFLHRVAELYEVNLDRLQDAMGAYMRALREDNSSELTLGHLERLAAMTGAWRELGELYAAEAEKSLDVPQQVDLLSRLARVYEEELGQTEEAIAVYRRILDVEFDNRPAVFALDRLFSASDRWAELSEVLRKEIQLAESDSEIISLQFRLGQVLEQNLGDLPAAIEVYREILITDPTHSATLGALEMLFLEGQHEIEIATILEPLYQGAAEYEKLHKIYEVQLAKLEAPPERQAMYQRLAELAERELYDQGRAFSWWGAAVYEEPRSELATEEVERLAREIAAWQELVDVYVRVLEGHTDPDVRRETLLRLARVYDAELQDPISAVETYLRVLEIDERDVDALAALDRLYAAAGMYDELVEILRRRIEVTFDGDEIVEMQLRRGNIYAEALADPDAALGCYAQVLEQDSRHRAALEAEERIYFRREEWQALYNVYEMLVDVADGDAEMAEIYARMARIASDALADDDGSAELWSRVLDIRGEDPQSIAALADLYARREMWTELVEVLERGVGVAESEEQRVALYKQMGTVWADKLGRERNALDSWLRAYELDPSDLETLRALAHLYRSTQSWEELSQTLQRIIDVGATTGEIPEDELIELYAQLGQLEGDILGRVDEAVEAWRRVVGLDPTDFRALSALEQLFTREARWEECIEVLERRALVVEDEASRLDTLLQAGAIWEEKVEDADRAAAIYERVREVDPGNLVASTHLEEIYRNQYKWEHLNEVLLERVEHTEDQPSRIEILQAVAKIYEQELGDQESAFVVLQAAFREDYAHESTARELERLATAANKWEDLLADYSQVVQSLESESPEDAADLWVKIGRWYGDHLAHIDWAIHSVQQALRINADHLGALSALADFQRKRQSWSELVEVLGRHAAIEPEPEKKVDLYLSLADLLESQLMDPIQAISAYQSALQVDPTTMDALVALERLYRAHEMWEQLIDVLGRMAELRSDPDDVVRLRLEVGEIWDERLAEAGQAINAYQDVLTTDPHNMQALRALEQLYERTGQSERYLDILEAQLDASPSDAEQISLYERMASAWEERFGKLDRAAECLEKIVALDERNYFGYQELARLYRQEYKWESLVDTYRRHIMAATDPPTRIDLYCAMGEVYERELQDFDRAIEAYTDVLAFDADEPRALDALGRLYENIEEWERAIDAMRRLVQLTEVPEQQVDLLYRLGRITYFYLGDAEEAEQQFLQALTIDASHVPTMEDLVKLYSDRGDWLKAAQMMVRAETYTPNMLDKERLLYDAARIYLDRLGDRDKAGEYLAAVMALDPEHVDAGEPLAELYFEEGRWADLSPILDMLVRKASQQQKDHRELNELYYRTARCADELNEFDKALQFYKAAYDIDSTYLLTLVGRADLLYKMQDWEGAGKIYQTILVQHRDSQAESDVVRTYFRLGMVRQNLGERRKALNMFEKALEIDPHHKDTLQAVIDIQSAQGDWEAVIHAKRGLLATADDREHVALLDEIGGIYHDQLHNPQKSISTYLEALDVMPEDHQLLQKVLDLYTETEQWKKAVEVIERFIALESDPIRRGSYYQAAGTICRDKVKAIDEAIDCYNRALDNFFEDPDRLPKSMLPRALKAFADIDRILTSKRDWKAQERAYRKMIKRLKPGDRILIDLWHSLGEIYRSRLQQYQSAIAAFEVAQQLDPHHRPRREILAELYILAGPDHADKAVQQHMEMLRQEPFKYDSYKALRKIYMDTHQYDKTWCVCNALAFLKKADPEELQFYEQYKPRGFVKAKQRMNEENWRRIYHPDENPYVSAVFGAIWQGAAMIRAQPHKAFGLRRKDRRQIETDQLQFSKIFYYVGQVLNVALPDVYLQPEQPGEIAVANTHEKGQLIPSFVVRANLLQGRAEKEIAFIAARWLTLMRPEHYLKLSLPTNTELKTAFLSAIVLVRRDFPVPPDMQGLVAQYLPEMQKRIQPQWLEQLGMVVNRFLQNAPEINLAKWGNAVEATAHRAGFVVCGDLEGAARLISTEQVVVGGPQVKDKIKELVLYAISEDYFAVRAHLGTTIG